ncbi:Macrolide export ATP-binding/permease protein macB [Capnocytophaga canis]|uniref:Macrolide export ATP-binding/permease protein macB n=2 Tax=Capnocytophaga canis TaxID=1848903 RepID=A0A0B7HZA0_9FLAO|nr:Macrolide export ATP-binding/permease protein macB [Capnocytophaga canis]CEN47446.1 Macrolide export ATP-binding/permease protein macB [Capnocytophaga canis]CEN50522.1 Macrolide export ATP-binding/permease protein macB [Capnocytophaga canis]
MGAKIVFLHKIIKHLYQKIMFIYLQLLKESFRFATKSLRDNKLRTFLSLLGVSVGIFLIILVLSAVDSLNRNIQENLAGLDKNSMYVSKFSFGPTDVPRWQRLNFPQVTYQEYEFLKKDIPNVEAMSYAIFGVSSSIKYEGKTIENVPARADTSEISEIEDIKVEKGRLMTESESRVGAPVIVLGHQIAQQLFENEDPIGKEVRYLSKKMVVIGVLKKYGSVSDNDEKVFLLSTFVRSFMNTGTQGVPSGIAIKPKKGVNMQEFEDILVQRFRKYRGLKPEEINNFFLNKMSSFTDMIDQTIGMMNLVGWIVGGFSILVGGFGIANIMFVSVRERTSLIGIQKSLGAKKHFILFQFLFEAVLLALIGGFLGLLFVWLGTILASQLTDELTFVLSVQNVIIGLGVSFLVGLISGIIPALNASQLNPVEAIRTGM